MQFILNKDLEFIIGNTVYKYFRNEIKVKNINEDWSVSESYPITRDEIELGSRLDIAQCDSPEYNFSRLRRKVSGEISRTCAFFYSELRVNAKHRRRSWGTWNYSDTHYLALGTTNGSVSFTPACTGGPCSGTTEFAEEYWASSVNVIVDYGVNCTTCPSLCNANVNYTATCLDNQTRGCSIIR